MSMITTHHEFSTPSNGHIISPAIGRRNKDELDALAVGFVVYVPVSTRLGITRIVCQHSV